MREILFRGKTYDTNEWVEGCYLQSIVCKDVYGYIMRDNSRKLDTILLSTLGQYTGSTDKNGKKIFEGDIVKGKDRLEKALEVYGYIDHKNGSFVIVGDLMTHYRWLDYELEVIGNKYDNPELPKEGKADV